MPNLRDRTIGALLGCAVGDAIGAPFEGLWSESIPSAESLLAGFHDYHGYPTGQFTDDTQLTIATVESLAGRREIDLADIARRISAYWKHHTIIGPGGACTHSAEQFLATSDHRSMGAPIGQAGNGTAMRTAILGLWYVHRPEDLPEEVAAISRLTHRDPRSVAGGVAIAEAARLLAMEQDRPGRRQFCDAISHACQPIDGELAELIKELPTHLHHDNCLAWIAAAGQKKPEFDQPIISPFIVPTVLASLYCILQHPESWPDAVTTAVRLGGDVDTLGAIVGALAGCRHGWEGIPENLRRAVQQSEYLRALAVRYYAAIAA